MVLAMLCMVESGGGGKGEGMGRATRRTNPDAELAAAAAAPDTANDEQLAVTLQNEEDKKAGPNNGTGGLPVSDEALAAELQAQEDKKADKTDKTTKNSGKKRKIVPVVMETVASIPEVKKMNFCLYWNYQNVLQ